MKSTRRSTHLAIDLSRDKPDNENHEMLSDFEDHGVRLLERGIRLTAASNNLVK